MESLQLNTYVKSLGEVALRVHDMQKMLDFYRGYLGFELRRRFEDDVAAIKLAEGFEGQVHTLTLFGKNMPPNNGENTWLDPIYNHTTVHHFAVTINKDDYETVKEVLEKSSLDYSWANHRWTGWKGMYVKDPEGNILEFVCYDEAYDEGKTGEYDFNKLHGAKSGKKFV